MEIARPFRDAVDSLSPDDRRDAKDEVFSQLRALEKDGLVHITAPVLIVTGWA
jgi:hypothetical protein